MRRTLLTLSLCLGAACGRNDVDLRPAPTADGPRQDGAGRAPASAGVDNSVLPPAPQFPKPNDKALSFDIKLARDSVADEAVLEKLAEVAPKDELPDVPIDGTGTKELNVSTFADQPRVQYYVDFFASRMHDRFQIWLDRMPRFEGYARERLVAQGLPGDLVYLALIESGFSSSAVSKAAAVGMWQFMPATGRGYGLRIDAWVDERRDPVKATDAAARHLKDLTNRFGSHYLAAAAYNAGAGRVGRSLTRMNASMDDSDDPVDLSSDEAFFELADTRLIVQETRDYVPKLIAAALIAKDPKKFGFTRNTDVVPFTRDSVVVDGGTGLDLIARLADTTLDALRDLNPHLLRLVTPPGMRYAVRVPNGGAKQITAAYLATPSEDRLAIASHTVRAGETVATVAKKYGVSTDVIRAANRSARGKRLASGSMLYIPVSNSIPVALLREPEPIANTRTTSRTHIVKRGETLGRIARKYRVSASSIRAANRMGKRAGVRVGQRLVIRRTTKVSTAPRKVKKRSVASRATPSVATARTHVVRKGETLGSIANRYGVKVTTLASANGMGRSKVVRVGQRLRIPG